MLSAKARAKKRARRGAAASTAADKLGSIKQQRPTAKKETPPAKVLSENESESESESESENEGEVLNCN